MNTDRTSPPPDDSPASTPSRRPSAAEIKDKSLDGLIKAIDWSHVVSWQIGRLHEAERDVLAAEGV